MLPTLTLALLLPAADPAPVLDQLPNTWVKRSPRPDAPPSPGLGYEASLVWDPRHRRVIRFAGHNQGGGGEQNAETWVLDPRTAKWELKEPNTSPPGVCCAQQNVFDTAHGRFLRFPAFSGSHGWQWFREIYLNNSAVWAYDLAANTWRDRRPLPAPRLAPLRCAAWDSHHGVVVVFGGEGSNEGTLVYDPHTNAWAQMIQISVMSFQALCRSMFVRGYMEESFAVSAPWDSVQGDGVLADGTPYGYTNFELLGACERTSVGHLVLRSSTLVYGARHDAPAYVGERTPASPGARASLPRDYAEIERIASQFAGRQPALRVTAI